MSLEQSDENSAAARHDVLADARNTLILPLLPAVLGILATLVTAFALANLVHHARPSHGPAIWTWLILLVLFMPLAEWSLRRPAVRHSELRGLAGISAGIIHGLFFGYAVYRFTSGMSETALMGVMVLIILASFSSLAIHGLHPARFFVFLTIAWLPYAYRLTDEHSDFGVYLNLTFWAAPLVIVLLSFVVSRWFKAVIQSEMKNRMAADSLTRQRESENVHLEQNVFLMAANHDIRQPLQAVSMYAFALSAKLSGRDQELYELASQLDVSVKLLGNLIDETLRFAKISSGEQAPTLKVFPADAVTDKLRHDYSLLARQKGIALRVPNSRKFLFSDSAIVERVLANLVSNAIRYTEEGGVLVLLRKRGAKCSIEVWDTGVGIDEVEQKTVFDTFYQASSRKPKAKGNQGGYGLGLSIARRLCAQIGTEISLKSVLGRGTCASFTVALSSAAEIEKPIAVVPMPASFNFSGATIVVVEDDRAIRESLEGVLQASNARVIAADGLRDLKRKLEGIRHIDFAIADLHIAGDVGSEVIREMRCISPQLDAVIMTGDASDRTLRELRRNGFKSILKPVDPQILMMMIDESVCNQK